MAFGVVAIDAAPGQFSCPVAQRWCSAKDMFGGATFGTVLEALELATGQTLLSAAIQFVQTAQFDMATLTATDLNIRTTTPAVGKLVTQARAEAWQGDTFICSVGATLQANPEQLRADMPMPAAPAVEACPPRTFQRLIPGSFAYTLDVRHAGVQRKRCLLWARWPGGAGMPLTSGILAIFADHPPYGIGLVESPDCYGLTFDSTLHIAAPLQGLEGNEWILLDLDFDALGERIAHCTTRMWSSQGQFLGIGAQTLRVRHWPAAQK